MTPTPAHAFDAQISILECKNCGAPVTFPVSGGQFNCEYCRTQNRILGRGDGPADDDQPCAKKLTASLAIEEELLNPERVARIHERRSNDRGPHALDVAASPPADLAPWAGLANHTKWIHTWLPELRPHWQQAVSSVEQNPPSVEVQHRVYWLAMRLAHAYAVPESYYSDAEQIHDSQIRRRAVLETALHCLPDGAYRSVLCCQLARAASHSDDPASARAWIGSCDGGLSDGHGDGELRIAFAAIYAKEQDAEAILKILGTDDSLIPVENESLCALAEAYRIHAYELLGQDDKRQRLARESVKRFGFRHVNGLLGKEQLAPETRSRLWLRIFF